MFDNGGTARFKFSYDFRLLFDTLTDKFAYVISILLIHFTEVSRILQKNDLQFSIFCFRSIFRALQTSLVHP